MRIDDEVHAAARALQIIFGPEHSRKLARIEADLASKIPTMRRKRQRKPTLDKLIAMAKAAGASIEIEGAVMRFGATPTSNPWDEVLHS